MTYEILILFILFQLKHFIVDFPLQKPYQYLNKGNYGHPGGILHSWLHGIATFLILLFFTTESKARGLAALDFFVHYHIDCAKVKINKHYGWKCDNSENFWILLGFDQLLHQLTYILIIYLCLN